MELTFEIALEFAYSSGYIFEKIVLTGLMIWMWYISVYVHFFRKQPPQRFPPFNQPNKIHKSTTMGSTHPINVAITEEPRT